MGAMHVMQVVIWSRFSLEEWLYQFGAWLDKVNYIGAPCGSSGNPIASAMAQAEKQLKIKKLGKLKQREIIASYFTSDCDEPRRISKSKVACQISDNEARAVQRLILDLLGQSEIMDDWLSAIISRYFYGSSWSEMVRPDRTANDARSDVKCGLAVLHSRYGFIKFA